METFIRSQTLRFGACSKHVTVTDNGRIAAKNNPKIQYADGVVYSASPLNGTVEFEVKITSYGTPWSGNIKIGVAKFRVGKSIAEVPRYSPEAPGHCVWSSDTLYKGGAEERQYGSIDLDSLREGDRVGLSLSHDGKLTFSVNGQSQGLAAQGVYEQGYDVYAVVDLYGNCRAIGVCAPNRKRTQSSSVESDECPPKKMKGGLCEYPQLPGIIFSDTSTPREVTISTKATRIDENGFSLSVPDNAVNRDVQLSIATSFSDSIEVPDHIESVSPAYLIGTSTLIEFSKDVDLVLQHTANVRTDEDCKDMVVMKASVCDSNPGKFSKFVELQGNDVTFKKNGHVGIVKLKSLVTSSYKVGRKKDSKEFKDYYSARLYKAVAGGRLDAIFCMCPDHLMYKKHCDAFAANIHSEMSEKSRGTFINALSFNSEQALLTNVENAHWTVHMDKQTISKLEVDNPLKGNNSSTDYNPPRITIELVPERSEKPVSTLLKVEGLSGDCSFEVTSDISSLPPVDTKAFQVFVDKFKRFLSLQDHDNSLVICGMDIRMRMEGMEPHLHHPKALSELLQSVKHVKRLISNVIELAEKEKADTGIVTTILHKFSELSPKIAKQSSSAGDAISWREVMDELMENCVELTKSIMELIKSSALLHKDEKFPGYNLSQPSQETIITPRGKEVSHQDTLGLSFSVPKGAVAGNASLSFAAGFLGGSVLPDGVESVSPAYLFETVTTIEFRKDVSLKLQHAANLETAEDCKDMIVLQASIDPSQGSGQVYKQVEGTTIEFSEEGHFGVVKIRSLFSSSYKIVKKKHNGSPEYAMLQKQEVPAVFYSARLYKAFSGIKVTAVFCVCQQNSIYQQYCDKVILKYYPEMVDRRKWTTLDYLSLTSDTIGLAKIDKGAWVISLDRSEISRMEIHSPERMKMDVCKLSDYPPRMHVNLTAGSRTEVIPDAELKVTGSKNEKIFRIANTECLPTQTVDTKDFVGAIHELEDRVLQLSDGPLVLCALDVVTILYVIEPFLLYLSSPESLIEKVKSLQQLTGTIKEKLGETKVDVATELNTISKELKRMVPVLSVYHRGSGPLASWKEPAEMLIEHCKDLVRCTMKLLKDEVRNVTSVLGVSLESLYLIKWRKRKFSLINRVSSKWKEFGTMLEIEEDLLEAWSNECRDDARKCWDKVMRHWLSTGGTSDYPVTWDGLYVLLEDVECSQVAAKLKEIISEMNK